MEGTKLLKVDIIGMEWMMSYRRYNVQFATPSGADGARLFSADLVIWKPRNGNAHLYDITNISHDSKIHRVDKLPIDGHGGALNQRATGLHQPLVAGDEHDIASYPEKSNSEHIQGITTLGSVRSIITLFRTNRITRKLRFARHFG